MGAPRRKLGRGAGKAPERPWSRREEAPFMPQARRASLLGRRAEVHHEKTRRKGKSDGGRDGSLSPQRSEDSVPGRPRRSPRLSKNARRAFPFGRRDRRPAPTAAAPAVLCLEISARRAVPPRGRRPPAHGRGGPGRIEPYISPCSRKEKNPDALTTTWSASGIPSNSPARCRRRVTSRSSELGVESPDG